MTTPRISIAMATYNAGPWLAEQLASFTAQSMRPDELVVCDDGSTDETVAALRAFAADAPFEVRVECNPETLTTTLNFEKAVSLCRGEIIFFADQDDVWSPEKIETLVAELDAHEDAGMVFSNGRVVGGEREPLGYNLWDSLWFHPHEQKLVREGRSAEVFVKHVVAAGTTLAFRSRYRELCIPFPDLAVSHDAWVSFAIAAVADVRIVDQNLIDYRVHGTNQLGLKRFALREQFAKAREQLTDGTFRHNAQFFGFALDRFETMASQGRAPRPGVVELVQDKIHHAKLRDEMSSNFFARLPSIAGEILNRGYWRFGYGLKSIAQDLFLR